MDYLQHHLVTLTARLLLLMDVGGIQHGVRRRRVAGAVINGSEILMLLAAVVILLSMLGINLSGLLIPAGVAAALASKDLAHNFLAGFFLFAVQVAPQHERCPECVQASYDGMQTGAKAFSITLWRSVRSQPPPSSGASATRGQACIGYGW